MAWFHRAVAHRLRTVALWVSPALLAAVLWYAAVPRVPAIGDPVVLLILFAVFVVADRTPLTVEVQRQTWGISLSEIPLVIGLFLVAPSGLLLARLASGVPLLFDRRRTRRKQVYNIGVAALEVAIAEIVFRSMPARPIGEPRSWLVALAAVAAADAVGALMVVLAIYVTNGPVDRRRLASLLLPALPTSVVNTMIGLIALVVVHVSVFGVFLLTGVAAVGTVGYRAYGRFLSQHENLGRIYEFTRSVERARSDPRVLAASLAQAREMLNAGSAVLWTRSAPAAEPIMITVRADGSQSTEAVHGDGIDALRAVALQSRRSRRFLLREVTDSRLRAELVARGATGVIIAPLRVGERVLGTFELVDRQGQLASFSDDDVRLVETLATHLTAAIENQQLLDRLRHAAYHDPLTQLSNRARLAQALEEAISAATGGSRPDTGDGSVVVLCQLDIDRFKEINDSLGHVWGDQLLVRLGERLRTMSPEGSTVARVGADEFAVLAVAPNVDTAEAHAVALRTAVSTPYSLAGLTIDVAVSVGVALAPEHALDGDTLMRRVDVALSSAKSTGRPVTVYHPSLDQASLHRLRLVTQLREALDSGQVVVRYQPKINLRSRELVGVEALVRWSHPEFGEVMPDDFVPLAEVTGLVGPLTMHVLRLSLEQCRRWLDRDLRVAVAVNLSARSLVDSDFPERVTALLQAHQVPADLLTFELTESSVMTDPNRMKPVLHRLHALGVSLSIDDFGTGYSSLAQLRRLPVDEVKIDKVFVLSMGTDLGDLAIVRAIIELGHSLGLRVVAEGVEDELARDLLAGNDCDVIQGFLVSRALDPDRFDAWLSVRTTARPAQPGVLGRRVQLTG